MKCQYCGKEINGNKGALSAHEKSCKIIQSLDIEKLKDMYYNDYYTIEGLGKIYGISHTKMSKLIIEKGRKRNELKKYKCQYCGKEIKNKGNLIQHENKCKNIGKKYDIIKDEIINLYVNGFKSIRDLRKIYKLQAKEISDILGDNVRSYSEANKLSHKLYPERFKHSEESKEKMRKKRLEWMKNNPEKTAWRLGNLSYPEKKFLEKIKEIGWDKKYLIVREKSMFPYYIDFAFENDKIAVEIDGSQHELKERKESDEKKDKLLIENGWRVLRFPASNVLYDLDNVINKIKSFLSDDVEYEKVGIFKYEKKKYYCSCGREKSRGAKQCTYCSHLKQRKVKVRPSKEQLIKEIKESSYVAVGIKYGVSDNTIRKWIKKK